MANPTQVNAGQIAEPHRPDSLESEDRPSEQGDTLASIFTQEQREQLRESQRKLVQLDEFLTKSEQCGLDCQMFREAIVNIGAQLAAIQKHFMPDIPQT